MVKCCKIWLYRLVRKSELGTGVCVGVLAYVREWYCGIRRLRTCPAPAPGRWSIEVRKRFYSALGLPPPARRSCTSSSKICENVRMSVM